MLHAVDGFHQLGQAVEVIVGITHAVAVIRAGLHILHQPVGEVIVVGSLDAGGGVGNGSQRALVRFGVRTA